MSRNKILKILLSAVFIVLAVGTVALYIYEVAFKGVSPTENLIRMLATVFICIGGLVRLLSGGTSVRRGLNFYQSEYAEHIRDAFSESPFLRKKLLCAIRLYNENRFDKAIKYLIELKHSCQKGNDFYAVNLFIALTLTDTGLKKEAVTVYNELIDKNLANTTVYGNLGSLHSSLGNYDDAIRYSRLSIQNDEKNPAPYNNLAKLYFDNFDFENAKEYAMKALEINHKFRQSASLLAIIYSLEEDATNAEKYSHIAISSGERPDDLKRAIEYYKTRDVDNPDEMLDVDD